MLRLLFGVVVVLALGWSGYWFVGATAARSGFETWFDARRAEGWAADYQDLAINGFPNRFDAGFTDIRLADPGTGWAWEAPYFQLLALSYQPNHVIAVWPEEQVVATPQRTYMVKSDDMRASAMIEPGTALALERATFTAAGLRVLPAGDAPGLAAEALRLAIKQVPAEDDAAYRLGLSAEGLVPPADWRASDGASLGLPPALEVLQADLEITFDKQWDRSAIEEARPQPREIRLRLAEAVWGRLELQAAGRVTVDAAGLPEGTITVKARNWREILQLARQSGALTPGWAETLEEGLQVVAALAGNPRTLDLPLKLEGGSVWLGPVPLGRAPVLRLR